MLLFAFFVSPTSLTTCLLLHHVSSSLLPTISPMAVVAHDGLETTGGIPHFDAGLVADLWQSSTVCHSSSFNARSDELFLRILSCHRIFKISPVKLERGEANSWPMCLVIHGKVLRFHSTSFGSLTPSKTFVYLLQSCVLLFKLQITSHAVSMTYTECVTLMNPQPFYPVNPRNESHELNRCFSMIPEAFNVLEKHVSADFKTSDLKAEPVVLLPRLLYLLLSAINFSLFRSSSGGNNGTHSKPKFLWWAFDKFGPLAILSCWIRVLDGSLGDWAYIDLAQVCLDHFIIHLNALDLVMTTLLTSVKS